MNISRQMWAETLERLRAEPIIFYQLNQTS